MIESNNRAAALLQQRIGSRPVLRLASDVGLHDLPDVPSLSLGTGLVTPLDLTAAFAMFPNGGLRVAPRALTRVVDADGGVAYDNPARQDRVVTEAVAYQMVSMLEDVVDRGTASPARTTYGVRFPAGGKTGTTDDFKDAWFVGFTSSTVVGVWVGEDQPATIGRDGYGARYALPILASSPGRRGGNAGACVRSRRQPRYALPPSLSRWKLPDYTAFNEVDDIRGACGSHGSVTQDQTRGAGFEQVEGIFQCSCQHSHTTTPTSLLRNSTSTLFIFGDGSISRIA